MPDKQLQAAIEEIKPILCKYDCCAIVMLQSQTHSEFLMHLEPSWSIVKFVELPNGQRGVHIKAKVSEYPSKAAHRKAVSTGIGVIMGFIHLMDHLATKLQCLVGVISEKTEIRHWEIDETDQSRRFTIE